MCTQLERIDLIFHHLQNQLTDISPTIYDFLKYREKIINSGPSSELKEILANELDLSAERTSLIDRIQKERYNEKKKDFAVATAKLSVIDKKLKETIKNLNRRLTESDYVNVNLQKMGDDIAWMKQRLDETEIHEVIGLLDDKSPCHDQSLKQPDLSTTIQKKERIVLHERTLCHRFKALKEDQEHVLQEENNLRVLTKNVEDLDGQLITFQDGIDPATLKSQRDIFVKNESTKRLHSQEKELMQYQIGTYEVLSRFSYIFVYGPASFLNNFCFVDDMKDQLIKEEEAHTKANEYLQNELLRLENDLATDRETFRIEIQNLDTKLEKLAKIREANLKELLQLRLRWQTIETERCEIIQEKERVKAEEELERKRRAAGEFIQTKIRTLYKDKFQKKKSTKTTKKSKKKGKKKK